MNFGISIHAKQIEETHMLLKHIQERDEIDMRVGLQQLIKKYGPIKAFEFQEDAYYGKNERFIISHQCEKKVKWIYIQILI